MTKRKPREDEPVVCTAYGYAYAADVTFCRSLASDAANRAMRQQGLSHWTRAIYDLAADKLDELLKSAAGCCAEGKFMWLANENLRGV